MANSFVLAQNYLGILDEIYKYGAKSTALDATNVEFVNADTIKYYKMTVDGLADYNRNNGFVAGSTTGTWETHQLQIDRGVELGVDRMDNDETRDLAFGKLLGEFGRTQMNPEIDAYRFAKLAGTQGILTASADIVRGTTDVAALIDVAEEAMNEKEVPQEGRLLYVSEAAYGALRAKITREIRNGEGNLNNNVEIYNEMQVVRVPQNRFLSAITLNDGSSAFGYSKATGAKKINFMIVHPSAVLACKKLAVAKVFSPEENQKKDGWLFQARLYHDIFVRENKMAGVYAHIGTTNA